MTTISKAAIDKDWRRFKSEIRITKKEYPNLYLFAKALQEDLKTQSRFRRLVRFNDGVKMPLGYFVDAMRNPENAASSTLRIGFNFSAGEWVEAWVISENFMKVVISDYRNPCLTEYAFRAGLVDDFKQLAVKCFLKAIHNLLSPEGTAKSFAEMDSTDCLPVNEAEAA